MRFESRVDPSLVGGLDVYRSLGFDIGDLSGATLRRLRSSYRKRLAAARIAVTEGVVTEDHRLAGPDGHELLVRTYRPVDNSGTLPALYWIHGGGMILGSVDQDDETCAAYAENVGCLVVSVDYRLAPEHPYPAPVEDCYTGLRWVAAHASDLCVDPTRIAIGGGSAGGGLAAGTCLMARDRQGPDVIFQLLVCPMLDDRDRTASAREFTGILSWSREHNASGWFALLGDAVGGADVSSYAAPSRAADLSSLPPTFIQVCELEVFRDEDLEYATRLLQGGVAVELHLYPGTYHGSYRFVPDAPVSMRMVSDQIAALRRALHR